MREDHQRFVAHRLKYEISHCPVKFVALHLLIMYQ